MIPCAKSRWFTAWFARQARGRLAGTFGLMRVAGREHLARAVADGPTLVVSNHSSWWDPLVAMVLTHHLVPADGYALMDADNLRGRPFFAKVGGFGVDRSSRRDGAEAIRYAEGLLDRPGRLVWIFPQGQERPLHERPLRFMGGAARLALRNRRVTVLPVALHYAFEAEDAPVVSVAVGPALPVEATAGRTRARQAEAVIEQLERVGREQSQPGSEGFEHHPLRAPSRWHALAERMLGRMTRPFVPGLVAPALQAANEDV